MPTYVYRCLECTCEQEVICSMSTMEDNKPTECNKCAGKMVRIICNTNKHTDNTPWRKGHYNSKEDHR